MKNRLVLTLCISVSLGLIGVIGLQASLDSRLTSLVTEQLNQSLNAHVQLGQLSVSLLSDFPSVGVDLKDLSITGEGAFEGVPLLNAGHIHLSLGLGSVFSGPLDIQGLSFDSVRLNVLNTTDGRSNLDISTPSEPSASSPAPWAVRLNHFSISDLNMTYVDESSGLSLTLSDLSHLSKGDLSDATVALNTHTQIDGLSLTQGGHALLSKVAVQLDAGVHYDFNSGDVAINDGATLSLNALPLSLNGTLFPRPDGPTLDLQMSATESTFKHLLSTFPFLVGEDMNEVESGGTFAFNTSVKGRYAPESDHYPEFSFALGVRDARLKLPDLPESFEQIALDLSLVHPEGSADLTQLTVSSASLSIANNPIHLALALSHPMSDPQISVDATATLALSTLARAFPIPQASASGEVDLDLHLNGALSDFESHPSRVKASGHLQLNEGRYTSEDYAAPLLFKTLDLQISPEALTLNALTLNTGPSDLHAQGTVTRALPWLFDQGVLGVDMNLSGDLFDVDGLFAPVAPSEAEDVVSTVPTDISLRSRVDFKRLTMGGEQLKEVRGVLRVEEGVATLEQMQATVFGGQVTLDGTYSAPSSSGATLAMNISAAQINLKETVSAFPILARILPIASEANGLFNSDISLSAQLDSDGSINLPSLASKGLIKTHTLRLRPSVIATLASEIGDRSLEELNLDGSRFIYDLADGAMTLEPTSIALGAQRATLSGGTNVLTRRLDFVLDLTLPKRVLAEVPGLSPQTPSAQSNIGVRIVGPWGKPKVKVSLGAGIKESVNTVVSAGTAAVSQQLEERLQPKVEALLTKAKEAAKKIQEAGKKAAEAVRTSARHQADALIAEAKNPIAKAAAKKTAEAMTRRAEAKAKTLQAEANREAEVIIKQAKSAGGGR